MKSLGVCIALITILLYSCLSSFVWLSIERIDSESNAYSSESKVNNFSSFSSSSFSKQFFSFLSSSAHSSPEEEDAAALTTKDERAEEEERAPRKNEEENVFLFGKLLFVVVAEEETEVKRAVVVVIFFYRFCGGGLPSFFTPQRPFLSLFSLSFARWCELQIKRESSLFAPLEPVRFPLSVFARRRRRLCRRRRRRRVPRAFFLQKFFSLAFCFFCSFLIREVHLCGRRVGETNERCERFREVRGPKED
jgi:hypothetical protein